MGRASSGVVRVVTVVALAVGALALFGAVRDEAAPAAPAPIAAEPPPPLVFVRSASRLTTIDSPTAEVAVSVGGGVSSPDGSRVFRTSPSATGDGMRLRVIDPRTGDRVWDDDVPDGFDVRLASYDGSMVAMMPPPVAADPGAGYPPGRLITEVLIEPTTGGPQRLHRLEGNFEPEAFSRDGSDLFLVEYVPAHAPTGYLVRQLDLATGRVTPVDSPDIGPRDVMGGTASSQVMSPDGRRLYTLYSVPAGVDDGPHGVATEGRAFVHVLDLDEKWAHCLDLPAPFGREYAASGPLAISPDGTELFVVDPDRDGGRGSLIAVDTENLAPGEVAGSILAPWSTAATVGPDGDLYVAGQGRLGASRVQVVETETMTVTDAWSNRGWVDSITVAEGDDLFLATQGEQGGQEVVVVAHDGERRRSIPLPDAGPMVIGPGSVSLPGPRNVLECAC